MLDLKLELQGDSHNGGAAILMTNISQKGLCMFDTCKHDVFTSLQPLHWTSHACHFIKNLATSLQAYVQHLGHLCRQTQTELTGHTEKQIHCVVMQRVKPLNCSM